MSYRDIEVWNRAIDFVPMVYSYAKNLPTDEQFGLISQMRRAAVSVPSNIAEGYGRHSRAEFARFTLIALGSVREIQTQLEICKRLGYPDSSKELEEADKVAQVIFRLAQSLRKPLP